MSNTTAPLVEKLTGLEERLWEFLSHTSDAFGTEQRRLALLPQELLSAMGQEAFGGELTHHSPGVHVLCTQPFEERGGRGLGNYVVALQTLEEKSILAFSSGVPNSLRSVSVTVVNHALSKEHLRGVIASDERVGRIAKNSRFVDGLQDSKSMRDTSVLLFFLLCCSPQNDNLWSLRKKLVLRRTTCGNNLATPPPSTQGTPQAILHEELLVTEMAISLFPKCPEGWQHRRWIVQQLFAVSPVTNSVLEEIVTHELTFVSAMCEAHPRNYPGWTYRAWIVDYLSDVNPHATLATLDYDIRLTVRWIDVHLRDASAVHHLLTRLELLQASQSHSQGCSNNTDDDTFGGLNHAPSFVEWIRRIFAFSQNYLRRTYYLGMPLEASTDTRTLASVVPCENGFLLRKGIVRLLLKISCRGWEKRVENGEWPLLGTWSVEDELRLAAHYTQCLSADAERGHEGQLFAARYGYWICNQLLDSPRNGE